MWQMKRHRASTSAPLLSLAVKVTVLLLAGHRVRSFSNTHHCNRNCDRDRDRDHGCQWSTSQSPRVALCAGNDGKLDWNPKSNPKIARLPSYSDDWLLNFHNRDQSEKQLATNSLAAWNEEIRNQQATIIEWQDSFQRNYLADFTPPMSNGFVAPQVNIPEKESLLKGPLVCWHCKTTHKTMPKLKACLEDCDKSRSPARSVDRA